MAIGKDVYCDTRIILSKLEQKFPDGALGASDPDQKAIERLLESWLIEAGIFMRASQLIPPDMPLLKDEKFKKDREDFSGRSWSSENIKANRPEALAVIRNGFKFLETTLLADNRDWILKTQKPTLADIEGKPVHTSCGQQISLTQFIAIWAFDWLNGMKGALDPSIISAKQFPKVFAWIARFNKEINAAKAKAPKPNSLKGDAAAQRILSAAYADSDIGVDSSDPVSLEKGQDVEVWPIDSGFRARDQGKLVGLNDEEIVIQIPGKDIHLHCPRKGFRLAAAGSPRGKL